MVTVGSMVMGPVAIVFVLGTTTCIGGERKDSANDKVEDPPRDDYSTETVVQEPSLSLEHIGSSTLEQMTSRVLDLASRAVVYEQAMVAADERALGAEAAGATSTARARRDEAMGHGRTGARLNLSLRAQITWLAGLLEEMAP